MLVALIIVLLTVGVMDGRSSTRKYSKREGPVIESVKSAVKESRHQASPNFKAKRHPLNLSANDVFEKYNELHRTQQVLQKKWYCRVSFIAQFPTRWGP